MKAVNEKFTDEEFASLLKEKNGKSWHDFILEKCLPKSKEKSMFDVDLDLSGQGGFY